MLFISGAGSRRIAAKPRVLPLNEAGASRPAKRAVEHMTRGCRILAAAFATTATWPAAAPGRSSGDGSGGGGGALGFVVTPAPPAALQAARASVALPLCGPWSAPSADDRRYGGDGLGRRSSSLPGLHAAAAVGGGGAHSGPSGSRGIEEVAKKGAAHPRLCNGSNCNSRHSSRAAFALAAAPAGGDGGDGSGLGGAGLDPESVARAREAAKNNDYDWFMEFIGGDEDDGDESSSNSSSRRGAADALGDEVEGGGGRSGGSRRRGTSPPTTTSASRRQALSSNDGRYGDDSRAGPDFTYQATVAAGRRPVPRRRRRPSPGAATADGSGMRRGARPRAPSDSAYDYDLDTEFDEEPGRGGWDYDPGLSEGIGARTQDVDVDKVR